MEGLFGHKAEVNLIAALTQCTLYRMPIRNTDNIKVSLAQALHQEYASCFSQHVLRTDRANGCVKKFRSSILKK
jgi:hypothetical protein